MGLVMAHQIDVKQQRWREWSWIVTAAAICLQAHVSCSFSALQIGSILAGIVLALKIPKMGWILASILQIGQLFVLDQPISWQILASSATLSLSFFILAFQGKDHDLYKDVQELLEIKEEALQAACKELFSLDGRYHILQKEYEEIEIEMGRQIDRLGLEMAALLQEKEDLQQEVIELEQVVARSLPRKIPRRIARRKKPEADLFDLTVPDTCV